MTLVLGAGSGLPLSLMRPPSGVGLPLVGWHIRGDLRPAHFLGMHAEQLLPLAGLALRRVPAPRGRLVLAVLSVVYVVAWCAAMAIGFSGRELCPQMGFEPRSIQCRRHLGLTVRRRLPIAMGRERTTYVTATS